MPVPYHRPPPAAQEGCAAFLDVAYARAQHTLIGAILVVDARGEPLEFVYTRAEAPTGFMWSETQTRSVGVAAVARALFEACQREPDLLLCLPQLGSVEYCKRELAPAIPFVQVTPAEEGGATGALTWIGNPPDPRMRATGLLQSLTDRGFLVEPFQRLRAGLEEVYPEVATGWDSRDSVRA
ncbi:MAG: hypothetical protein FJX77_00140 [Armatimonadetes bacterium]|nr:hypothetical protein [Armatimonadota bacterium]MBM3946819.1 hypothetical protein [SAR202 cluster bacterium]